MPASDTYNVVVTSVALGGATTIDARNAVAVIVRAGTGATVTVSAVDSIGASVHTTGAENTVDVAANTFANLFSVLGAWPFYRVSSAGGTARVGVYS
jgi:hypothetical protein